MTPKRLLAALSLASATLAACATQDFDPSALDNVNPITAGTVERVQDVPLASRFDTFAEIFEHSVRPETAKRLLIRLDDGSALTLEQDEPERFEAGQRVHVFTHANGADVVSD